MQVVHDRAASGEAVPAARHPGRRLDIEGLRAVAVVLVLLYHAGLPVTGGFVGVDVFFVLSGFLITGLLVRELEETGRVSLRRFWARRARRLLPAAAVVLVVTAVLTWLTASVIDLRPFGLDIFASATYLINWPGGPERRRRVHVLRLHVRAGSDQAQVAARSKGADTCGGASRTGQHAASARDSVPLAGVRITQ